MPNAETSALERLTAAVSDLDRDLFTRYKGGWINQIGIALWDAVYSIGSQYSGVAPRLDEMRGWLAKEGLSEDSLHVVANLPEDAVVKIMGATRVAPGRARSVTKAAAARQAAIAIAGLEIDSASDLRDYVTGHKEGSVESAKEILKTYSSVYGLGKVTGEYFLMLLGIPGVKADRMVTRFVAKAVGKPVGPEEARSLVVAAHEALSPSTLSGVSLTQLDHAIWLYTRGDSE